MFPHSTVSCFIIIIFFLFHTCPSVFTSFISFFHLSAFFLFFSSHFFVYFSFFSIYLSLSLSSFLHFLSFPLTFALPFFSFPISLSMHLLFYLLISSIPLLLPPTYLTFHKAFFRHPCSILHPSSSPFSFFLFFLLFTLSILPLFIHIIIGNDPI